MKIVVTGTRGIPNIMGGVETHCEELFPRIARKGFEVTVIRRKSYVRDTLSSYKGITLSDIETPRKKSLEAIVHTFRAIVRAKRLKANIVHIHAVGPALLTPLARLLGMKVVFTHHGPDYDRDKWGMAAKTALRLGEAAGTLFANEVIVISHVIDDLLIRIWGMPAMISAAAIVYAVTIPGNTINPVGVMQLLLGTALAITAEFYRGKGSQQSGSFAALLMLSVFELIMAFHYTFRMPFDAQGGTWMLELSAHGILPVLLPGFILRHITRKQCSKN